MKLVFRISEDDSEMKLDLGIFFFEGMKEANE
jgi:hypothetical protein